MSRSEIVAGAMHCRLAGCNAPQLEFAPADETLDDIGPLYDEKSYSATLGTIVGAVHGPPLRLPLNASRTVRLTAAVCQHRGCEARETTLIQKEVALEQRWARFRGCVARVS